MLHSPWWKECKDEATCLEVCATWRVCRSQYTLFGIAFYSKYDCNAPFRKLILLHASNIMPKKISLKSALSSQQARLKKNARAQESAQKQEKISKAKGKSKANSTRRSVIPFHAQDKILLIGEGNFSFTLALLKHPTLQYLPPENVTATAYDSEDECMQKYPDARANINELRGKGIEVLFNVDATALEKYKPLKGRRFDRVVWNFPHAGK